VATYAEAEAKEPEPPAAGLAKTGEPDKKADEKKEDSKPKESVNVFDAKITSCGAAGDQCSWDGNTREVCVSFLPYDQDKFWNGMPGKEAGKFEGYRDPAGEWKTVGKCVAVWELGIESMVFGNKMWFPGFQTSLATFLRSFGKRLKYGFVQDTPVCDALPSNILDSEFSKDMYQNCEIMYSTYEYKTRTDGKGGRTSSYDKTLKKGEEVPPQIPFGTEGGKCQRFRDAIEQICTSCAEQADTAPAGQALMAKCESIGMATALATESSDGRIEQVIPFALALFMSAMLGLKVFRRLRKPLQEEQEEYTVLQA
jgi:hypothetical protein